MTSRELQIGSMDELARFSGMIAKAGYFGVSPEQAAVKILAGHELRIGPLQALMNVHVIKDREGQFKVTLAAGLVAGLIKRSDRYDYRVTESTATRCEIEFFELRVNQRAYIEDEHRRDSIGTSTFTIEEADRAGLLVSKRTGKPKHNWKAYPSDMLFARALTRGARRFTPDVFGGPIYTPEEIAPEGDGLPDMRSGEVPVDLGQPEDADHDAARDALLDDLTMLREGQAPLWLNNEICSDPVGGNSWFGPGVKWVDGALDDKESKAVRQRFHIWTKEASTAYDDLRQWPLYAIKAQGVINFNRALRDIEAKRQAEETSRDEEPQREAEEA